MPPDAYAADDPRAWLEHARSDLALAGADVPGVKLELLAFHAQQAAEKAIKAVLLRYGVEFPYVHNLGKLLHLVRGAGFSVPAEVDEAVTLSVYAVTSRYPLPPDESLDPEELADALRLAAAVLRWADAEVNRS